MGYTAWGNTCGIDQRRCRLGTKSLGSSAASSEKCPTSPLQPGKEFDSGLRQGAEAGFKA